MSLPEIDIVLQIFSTFEARGRNGRFRVRDPDGAMAAIGRKSAVPPEAIRTFSPSRTAASTPSVFPLFSNGFCLGAVLTVIGGGFRFWRSLAS